MKFTYTRIADRFIPGGYAYIPILTINIGDTKLPVKCIIDSGSPISMIHSPLAVAAGIIPAKGERGSMIGVGGELIEGYFQDIELTVYGYLYTVEAFLTADLMTPYCLLGQIGFFQNFRIIFDLRKLQFEIIPK